MAPFSPLAIDDREGIVLVAFASVAALVGLIASIVLAVQLDDRATIPTAYWEKVLTIAGVATLPLVAAVVLVVRAAISTASPLSAWGATIVIAGTGAFALAIAVILICLFQIVVAADAAPNTTPGAPEDWVIWVATIGTGLTLSAAAVGVAATALNTIDTA